MDNSSAIKNLLALMARLRNPETGCPWDIEQNFKTIAPYTIEEAYEVADAIESNNMDDLKDELGDLLLQVVFHAQMAKEQNLFTFDDIAAHVTTKMIHRHPHVFGEEKATSADDVENRIWDQRKALEKQEAMQESILDDVPQNLPALLRAQKLQKRAASVGFEWAHPDDVLDKMEEEIAEMREALENEKQDEILDELGDLFFVLTNYGRMLGANCEDVLRQSNNKFSRRFKGIESDFKEKSLSLKEATLTEMEASWQDQKRKEKKNKKA